MRILIIEKTIGESDAYSGTMSSYDIESFGTNDLQHAKAMMKQFKYDAILLFNLGVETTNTIKTFREYNCPIVVYSRTPKLDCKAYEAGADFVYQTKHLDALHAMIKNNIKIRENNTSEVNEIFTAGNTTIDYSDKIFTVDNKKVHLTVKEFSLLKILVNKQGGLCTSEFIYEKMYPSQSECPLPKTVDVFVCKLRKKLRESESVIKIDTIWGRGYKITISK